MNGVQLIAAERTRQIEDEGWTPEHDDTHTNGELAKAAESYVAAVTTPDEEGDENGKARPAWDWPWDKQWWKPSEDPIRNLVKAGALIAAEIDRLQRKSQNDKLRHGGDNDKLSGGGATEQQRQTERTPRRPL